MMPQIVSQRDNAPAGNLVASLIIPPLTRIYNTIHIQIFIIKTSNVMYIEIMQGYRPHGQRSLEPGLLIIMSQNDNTLSFFNHLIFSERYSPDVIFHGKQNQQYTRPNMILVIKAEYLTNIKI